MNVSVTPALEAFVRKEVESGRYNNASEVVRAALRLLQERAEAREAALARARVLVEEGLASGPAEPWDKEKFLARARARQRQPEDA
jgi:antitoxin ParD1/3/4